MCIYKFQSLVHICIYVYIYIVTILKPYIGIKKLSDNIILNNIYIFNASKGTVR